jgi:hypothetical protein
LPFWAVAGARLTDRPTQASALAARDLDQLLALRLVQDQPLRLAIEASTADARWVPSGRRKLSTVVGDLDRHGVTAQVRRLDPLRRIQLGNSRGVFMPSSLPDYRRVASRRITGG